MLRVSISLFFTRLLLSLCLFNRSRDTDDRFRLSSTSDQRVTGTLFFLLITSLSFANYLPADRCLLISSRLSSDVGYIDLVFNQDGEESLFTVAPLALDSITDSLDANRIPVQ